MDAWSEAVLKAMNDRGFIDPYQLIAALLYALREQHRQSVLSDKGGEYRDGLDGYTGQHATTVAESVGNLLHAFGTANLSGADLEQDKGNIVKSNHMDWVGRGQAALADLLDHYLPVWNAEGMEARERAGYKDERTLPTDMSGRDRRGNGQGRDSGPDPDAN